jgi:exodeoxyribonuclease V alpha subunit
VKIFGELQDMVVDVQPSNTTIFKNTVETFNKKYLKTQNILETQVIVAVKSRGDVSCYRLNQAIKDIVNPFRDFEPCIEVLSHKTSKETFTYKIQVGDKVINTKNNYNTYNLNDETTPIFNGNLGIVTKIQTDGSCVVDYVGIGKIIMLKEDSKNLELAYALTCHKVQGSGFNDVIIALDTNSYIMNCAEWLYTAITRAKKTCTLISTNSTISQTIRKKEVKKKQTFLGEFLKR